MEPADWTPSVPNARQAGSSRLAVEPTVIALLFRGKSAAFGKDM
jgi:hypothetical protein